MQRARTGREEALRAVKQAAGVSVSLSPLSPFLLHLWLSLSPTNTFIYPKKHLLRTYPSDSTTPAQITWGLIIFVLGRRPVDSKVFNNCPPPQMTATVSADTAKCSLGHSHGSRAEKPRSRRGKSSSCGVSPLQPTRPGVLRRASAAPRAALAMTFPTALLSSG